MPTPVGHALAGLAVAGIAGRSARLSTSQVAVLVFCAIAPDLDLALRLFDGVNHHRGPSHSIGMAALAGCLATLMRRLGFGLPGALAVAAAWGSHVLLDYVGLDTMPPFGEMALWPVSRDFFIAPMALFYDVHRSFSPEAIRHNIVAVALEIVIVGPLAWLCWKRFANSAHHSS